MHRRGAAAAAVTRAARARPWQAAVGMFTVIPVRAAAVDRDAAGRAVLWLPAAGLLVAAPAAGVLLAAGQPLPRRLLGAALAVAVMAVLTGGLHLDGLADTADGLASRRPAAEALEIMRRGDVGPLGVAALLFTVLLQITALAALPAGIAGAAALAVAAVTGRVAVVAATGPGFPAARPEGFGALVAGTTAAGARVGAVAVLLAAATPAGWLAGGPAMAWREAAGAAAGLAAGSLLCRAARRRLGGVTGDVFGAAIEVSATVTLVVLAVLS